MQELKITGGLINELTSSLVRDVREEGGDLALALHLGAAMGEAWVRVGGVQERASRVEVLALAPVRGLVLDAVEERVGDDATHVRAATAAALARARATPLATVGVALAAVTILAAAVAWLAAAVLRGGRAGASAEEC